MSNVFIKSCSINKVISSFWKVQLCFNCVVNPSASLATAFSLKLSYLSILAILQQQYDGYLECKRMCVSAFPQIIRRMKKNHPSAPKYTDLTSRLPRPIRRFQLNSNLVSEVQSIAIFKTVDNWNTIISTLLELKNTLHQRSCIFIYNQKAPNYFYKFERPLTEKF